jgi:hypothetical protein
MDETKTVLPVRSRVARQRTPENSLRASTLSSSLRSRLDELVENIYERQKILDETTTAQKADMATLLQLMETAKVPSHTTKNAVATCERPKGKATNVIDVRKAYELLGDLNEFFQIVSVRTTAAKKFIPGKELDAITTRMEPKESPMEVKVSPKA